MSSNRKGGVVVGGGELDGDPQDEISADGGSMCAAQKSGNTDGSVL